MSSAAFQPPHGLHGLARTGRAAPAVDPDPRHASHELDPRSAVEGAPVEPFDPTDHPETAALDHAEHPARPGRDDRHSLTHRTATGLAWLLAQAVGSKLVGFASQLILAKLLIPEQFGIYSFALGLATIINVVQHAGVGEILVHRQARRDLWTNPAAWISLGTGLVAMLSVLIAAAVFAVLRPDPLLAEVIALISVTALLSALAIVPTALLQIQMRHREVGIITFVSTLLGAAVSILLAWQAPKLGFPVLGGPVALALGAIAASLWQTLALWFQARPRLRASPQFKRWRFMLADSARLLASGLINTVARQGATIVLGILHSVHTVGVFSFGFMLSLQSVALLQTSLNAVLFPALAKLQDDPRRMLAAYVRSSRLLAVIGMPACFLQVAAAEPVMRLLFDEKWIEAVPVVQWLSVGMAFSLLGSINTSLIKAQGRFGLLVHVTIAYGLTYVVAVALGGFLGEHVAMSVAVCLYMMLWGPLGAFIAARSVGGTLRDLFSIYGSPGVMAAVSVGLGYLAGAQLPAVTHADLAAKTIVITAVAAVAHAAIVRLFAADALAALLERLDALAPPGVVARIRRVLWMPAQRP